jgi:hypothetical protein
MFRRLLMREYPVHWAALVGISTGCFLGVGYMGHGTDNAAALNGQNVI